MDKQNSIHRIINCHPWRGAFNLLEIFIFIAGIFVTVLLFRFTSNLNDHYGSIYIRRTDIVLGSSVGFLLVILSWMMWRNRMIQQSHVQQRQVEDELRLANWKLSEIIAESEQRTQGVDIIMQAVDLLSACPNLEEAYKIIENQLGKLNLADSGTLNMIKPSRNNLQQVAVWGQNVSDPPVFAPSDCWGLRRGRLHTIEFDHSAGDNDPHANPLICPHISPTVPADYLCVPLVAHGETLGILHLRHCVSQEPGKPDSGTQGWFTPQKIQLATRHDPRHNWPSRAEDHRTGALAPVH